MAYNGIAYGDVVLYIEADMQDNIPVVPGPDIDLGVVETKIPYANVAEMQFTGRGNAKYKLKAEIRSDAEFYLLMSYAGDGVGRDLNDVFQVGINLYNMHLTRVGTPRRTTFESTWTAELEFTQLDR